MIMITARLDYQAKGITLLKATKAARPVDLSHMRENALKGMAAAHTLCQ